MKKTITAYLCLLILLLNIRAFAQEKPLSPQQRQMEISKPTEQNKISLDIKGMDITDVLKMLATRSGLNIIVGKNVTGKVTLFLKDVDLWEAFQILLSANELAYDKKNDIINVMTQRDYELINGERFQDKKRVQVFHLKNAKAADLSKAILQLKSNIGKVVVDEGSNTLTIVDTQEKMEEIGSFIEKTDLPLETRIFELQYATAEKISAKLAESITKSIGSMKIDERTNKIAVTDYPDKLNEIARIITAFDEKTQQVLIDAQIIEISPQKDQFTMGIDWDYWLKNNVRLVSSLAAPSLSDVTSIPNKLSFGVAAANETVNTQGDYKAVIDLLRTIGKTKILSSPRIMALNNQEAKILVGTKEAYITSAITQSGESAVTSQSVNFVDVGIKLYVTPTINRDGFVTMKIKPEISSAKRTDITADGKITQIPIVTTSESETTIMVKDGTTIIIAGLKKDQQEKEEKKIPILGDIPILNLFTKNKRTENIKTELVIFITPHVISGAEPLDYNSLTGDKDISYIQSFAQAHGLDNAAGNEEAEPDSLEAYKSSIKNKIKAVMKAKIRPDAAQKGKVYLSFTLDDTGNVKGPVNIISSTNQNLNVIAELSVLEASPFSPMPAKLGRPEENFSLTLTFE
ncbi:MAG: secretin N-terminal domain-containing protein [Candidatus Omnitrophota bacterium]